MRIFLGRVLAHYHSTEHGLSVTTIYDRLLSVPLLTCTDVQYLLSTLFTSSQGTACRAAAPVLHGTWQQVPSRGGGICEVTPRVLRRCALNTAPPPALCVPCFMRVALDAW